MIDYHVLLVIVLIAMATCLFSVMFEMNGAIITFKDILGTSDKKETIEFIAFGMGGVVAAIVATAISRRADAQMRNNELIEKGHDNERFQNMTANLGHDKVTVRIATFYQFYSLAETNKGENPQKLREDIFEMLCSYLCSMPDNVSDKERQTLFYILFKDKFKSNRNGLMPDDFRADLREVNLSNMILWNANLAGAYLAGANLSDAKLSDANLVEANLAYANLVGANLLDANLSGAYLLDADLSGANLVGTNLSSAYLSDAYLSGANFVGANLAYAYLPDADLSGAYLSDVDLSDANLSGAILQRVRLKGTNLQDVDSVEKTDFREVTVDGKPISSEHIPSDKGEYYANWNPPPKKEEN